MPNKDEQFCQNDVIKFLTGDEGTSKSMVLLFPDSMSKKRVNETIGETIRTLPVVLSGKKFRVAFNEFRVGDKRVFLGVKGDEVLLSANYSKDQIKFYAEGK